jgi:histidine triad (HIT) family protein
MLPEGRQCGTGTGWIIMAYDPSNIFARILRGEAPAHKVHEDEHTIAILDVMPQAEAHTLVLPKYPAEDLFDLPPDYAAALMRTARHVAGGLRRAFAPDGITVMQFNGAAAGQTVFHYHMHLLPRWEGRPLRSHGRGFADPEVLAEQAEKLRQALAAQG